MKMVVLIISLIMKYYGIITDHAGENGNGIQLIFLKQICFININLKRSSSHAMNKLIAYR